MKDSEVLKIVVDTNVIFMALYNPRGKAARIIELADKDRIKLFSTDTVKIELYRVIKKELNFNEEKIRFNINNLPIIWIGPEIYEKALDKTRVKHKPNKPVEALSLILNCKVLSADKHFKDRADIDRLLESLED